MRTGAQRYVVVGAGVFGAWTAYELLRLGQRVVLVDQYGPGNERASSGGETRIIRAGYGADEIYTRMAARSLVRWKELFRSSGRQLLVETGVLWIGRDAETVGALSRTGVRFEEFTASELRRRFPQMCFEDGETGIWEPEGGVLMARQSVQLVVSEFIRMGGEYRQACVARPAELASPDVYVLACGPWLGELVGAVQATRQEVFFFGRPAGDSRYGSPEMPVWLDFCDPGLFYGFPEIDGRGVKIASHLQGPQFDPDSGSRVVTAEGERVCRSALARRFPGLADAPVVGSRVCVYENTASGDFLIDRHPEFENVWIVGGGSGHGFKHGPAVGEYAASRLTRSDIALEPRFCFPSPGRPLRPYVR